MAVHAASYQFSAAYGTSMAWKREAPPAAPAVCESVENAKPVKLELSETLYEGSWQKLWGAEEIETVNEDGTVTKTVSGGVNFLMAHRDGRSASGRTDFEVSVTFDPAAYEAGQLTGAVDLMTAAYAASGAALKEGLSCLAAERFQAHKDAAARSFADMVGAPMEEQGRAGEWDKVYRSVHAAFASLEEKYQAVLDSTDRDLWMDADQMTAAMNLRKIGRSFPLDPGKTRGLYSLRELECTAVGVRSRLNLHA